MRFAQRMNEVRESATLRMNALAQKLKAEGKEVINLTAGEPDFSVPESVNQAVIQAVNSHFSKYTPAAGLPDLRSKVAAHSLRRHPGISEPWQAKHVVITNGGKHALINAMLCTLNPGDEVLIPAPFWVSYPEMSKVCEAVPVILDTDLASGYKLTAHQLEQSLKTLPRAKMLILNSPSNPTGVLYSKEEFQALGQVIEKYASKDFWIISDEIYEEITFDGKPFCSFLEACPSLQNQTITINGLSKSAAMTGWRVGWSLAPADITEKMITLQGQSTSNISGLGQKAALAALDLPASYYENNRKIYQTRRDLCLQILRQEPDLDLLIPGGAFYLFIGVKKFLKPHQDVGSFCESLLEKGCVAGVSGAPFGQAHSLRFSFASDEKVLRQGMQQFIQFLRENRK